MQPVRQRINPKTFVITLRQIAKHLKISQERILNWEKWYNVLWVHIEGKGGYFISYRKLQQWLAACRTLIRGCRNLNTLNVLWLLSCKKLRATPKRHLPNCKSSGNNDTSNYLTIDSLNDRLTYRL
jgi:hypothetical protein